MKPHALSARFGLLTVATAALCLCAPPSVTAARAPRFVVRELSLPGSQVTEGFKINDRGQVIGTIYGFDFVRPFLYSHGKLIQLNVGQYGSAVNLNDHGQIIGYGSGPILVFLYDDGELSDVRADAGQAITTVRAINNQGAIVGNIDQADGPPAFPHYARAFVFAGGEFRLLPTLPGGFYSDAGDINNRGQIAGQSSLLATNGAIVGHAVIWDSRGIRDLGTLPGAMTSLCTGINDRGQATGYSDTHGFIYTGGQMRSLGNLSGHFYNTPRDINNFGHIVGESSNARFEERRAFLYANGVLHDLNDLIPRRSGWFLVEANGINDRGEIVGTGIYRERRKAFLLKPLQPFRLGSR
jgi:probable HAF family extracellular repeat protein